MERVNRALVYVESRLNSDLSLGRVAGHVSMSPFHFQRAFSAVVGETPAGYVRRLRLEAAATVLMRGWSVPRALHAQVGYSQAEPFIRAFKRRFGVTPTEYRRRKRGVAGVEAAVEGVPECMRVWKSVPGSTDLLALAAAPADAGRSCVRVERFGAVRLAFIRGVGEGVEWRGLMERVLEWAAANGRISEDPVCLVMVHDDAEVTEPSRRRVDCCVVVAPRARASGEVGIRNLPRSAYAVATVEGGDGAVERAERWLVGAVEVETRRALGLGARLRVVQPPGNGGGKGRRELTDLLVPVRHEEDLAQIYFRRVRGGWTMGGPGEKSGRSKA